MKCVKTFKGTLEMKGNRQLTLHEGHCNEGTVAFEVRNSEDINHLQQEGYLTECDICGVIQLKPGVTFETVEKLLGYELRSVEPVEVTWL